jgi:hypothetical protein
MKSFATRLALACLSALTIGTGVALATGAVGNPFVGSDGTLGACAQKQVGLVRLLQAGQSCLPSELSVSWNQRGPAGATGPAGPKGPQGETGATGATGPAGTAGAKGETGAQGPQGDPGAPGAPGTPGTPGADGRSVQAVALDPTSTECSGGGGYALSYSDGTSVGVLCNGANGAPGTPGAAGPKGDAGADGAGGLTPGSDCTYPDGTTGTIHKVVAADGLISFRCVHDTPGDTDGDGVPDATDNCVSLPNHDQADADGDTLGDACDPFPADAQNNTVGDCQKAVVVNGVLVNQPDDTDVPPNQLHEIWQCENGNPSFTCEPGWFHDPRNAGGSACETSIESVDRDGDGVRDDTDNCSRVANPDQANADGDLYGDACDPTPNEANNYVVGDCLGPDYYGTHIGVDESDVPLPEPHAIVGCNYDTPSFACEATWADSNGDLGQATGNGCETSLTPADSCAGFSPSSLAHVAAATCTQAADGSPQYVITSCQSGFVNADGDASNGCEIDTLHDVANCGAVGNSLSLPNAVAACVDGHAAIAMCFNNYYDIDGLAANGCEQFLVSDLYEPNDTTGQATVVAPGELKSGSNIFPAGDVDYWTFTAPCSASSSDFGATLTIDCSATARIINANGTFRIDQTGAATPNGIGALYSYHSVYPGVPSSAAFNHVTYTVQVFGNGGAIGNYQIVNSF